MRVEPTRVIDAVGHPAACDLRRVRRLLDSSHKVISVDLSFETTIAARMITGCTKSSSETIEGLHRVQLISRGIHGGRAGGEVRAVPEAFIGAVIRRRDPLELAQIVVRHRLNSAFQLTGGCGRLCSRRRAEVEVVLEGGTGVISVSDRRRIRKGVAINGVGEGVGVGDGILMPSWVGARARRAGRVVVGVGGQRLRSIVDIVHVPAGD